MISHIIALSILCIAVILIRALFKNRVSARIVYALWLVVLIKLCIPVSFISIDVPLPSILEEYSAVTEAEAEELPLYQGESAPTVSAPAIQTTPMNSQVSGSTAPEADLTVPDAPTEPVAPNEPILESEKVTQEVTAPSIDPLKLIFIIWALGSFAFILIFSAISVITQVKLRKSREFYKKEGRVSVYVSDGISSPCVTGIIPTVYITSYAKECKDLELIIKHELTHIRHGDHLWAVVRIIAIVLFWWNPFIWAAAILSKRDAELACDESVVKHMSKTERLGYSRLILDMIPKKRTFAVSFADAPIKYRLFRLTGKYKTKLFAAIIATVLVAVSFCFAFISYASDETDDDPDLHVHEFEKATCTSPALCECGESDGDALGHIWHEATCTIPMTCSRCKATEGTPISHTWTDATCDEPKTCVVCKFYEGDHLEHVFSDATCTSPRLCTLCGGADGEPLGHSFAAATCTAPKTCTRCGGTEGVALGHKYYLGTCSGCNNLDNAFFENIRSQFYSSYKGYSKKSAVKTLSKLGYDSAETEYILSVLNINWYEQALIAARFYTNCYMYYTEDEFRSNMVYLGFTESEIDYAIKIAMEENPPRVIIADIPGLLYPFGYSDDWLTQCREYNEKYGKNDDDDDDDWKYGYGDPFVWDYGSYYP